MNSVISVMVVNVIVIKIMNNEEKALIYDECIRESDRLQREISKIKSEYVVNIPLELQEKIILNESKIATLVLRLESLFK